VSDYMKEMEWLLDAHERTLILHERGAVWAEEPMSTRAALLAHAAQAERDAWGWTWQPIETAPKDGSYLLVSNGHGVWVARFKSVYQSGWKPPSPWQSMMLNHAHIPSAKRNGSPTHWMPLPTPPIAALAEGAQEPVHRPVHQPVHGALNNEA